MSREKTLGNEELSILCEQIGLILRGGLPLHDGIEALCEGYGGTPYADHFQRLNEAVSMQGSLYEGLKAAGVFPAYMMEMVQIGERTGELDSVMEGLSGYYDTEAHNHDAIRNAVFYPLLLIVMMAVLIGVLIWQVLPIFDDVFASFAGSSSSAWLNVAMNAGKAVLMAAGIVIVLMLAVLAVLKLDKSQNVKRRLIRMIPVLAQLNCKMSAARFASTLGMMLRSGYPLEESLELIQGLFTDKDMQAKMEKCYTAVQEGADFPDAVETLGIFEPLHCRMIRMGFKAGQTDHVMTKLAGLYAEELDNQISHLVSIIEPSLVALMSLILGAILLAVMLPLLSVMGSIG